MKIDTSTKAKRHLLGIDIPRDELAVRIAQGAIGMTPPANLTAGEVLESIEKVNRDMANGFRRAADLAVAYFHECINAGKAPH